MLHLRMQRLVGATRAPVISQLTFRPLLIRVVLQDRAYYDANRQGNVRFSDEEKHMVVDPTMDLRFLIDYNFNSAIRYSLVDIQQHIGNHCVFLAVTYIMVK